MRTFQTLILSLAAINCCSCNSTTTKGLSGNSNSPDTLERILINQVSCFPNSDKITLLRVKTDKF